MAQIKPEVEAFARIKVIGVGGSGKNAVNHMINSKVRGVDFIAVNTDAQDLHHSLAKKKIHIGKNLTKGRGAGMNPEVGQRAAEETPKAVEAPKVEQPQNQKENEKSWWQDLGNHWKAILSILGILSIGIIILSIGVYKSRKRLNQLRQEIAEKEVEKALLAQEIQSAKDALQNVGSQIEQSKASLVEAEKRRLV